MKRAGQRLSRAERHFAHTSFVTQRGRHLHRRQKAPRLHAKRGRLSWRSVAGVRSYLVIRKGAGLPSRYTVVNRASIKPPAVPGQRITYRVRTAVVGSAWSTPITVAYAPKARKDPRSAPIVAVSGGRLSWKRVGRVKDYVVVRTIAGRPDVYSAVHGTSAAVTPVPGTSATYSVRTARAGSAWSSASSIAFPGAASAPAPAPAPTASAASAGSGFWVGLVMRTWTDNDRAGWNVLKPKAGTPVRFELDATTPASSGDQWVDFYASLGATPQPLAGFRGVPTDAQIDALAAWARSKAGKIKLIEFGNEDSYTYRYGDGPGDGSYQARARAYAAAAKRLGQALAGSGVGVLAQADDGNTNSSVWVDQMFAATPDLHKWVAGWVIHPYGTEYVARVNRMYAQLAKHGGDGLKAYATELGLAVDNGRTLSDNYGWPTNMTYDQAAVTLRKVVDDLKGTGKVAEVMLYQSTDQQASGTSTDREAHFGLVQQDGTTPKGALTATASALLAQP